MKCPVCREPDLVMTERQQIEIDYCPKCRGVWLDRGELDKILERAQREMASEAPPSAGGHHPQHAPPPPPPPPHGYYDRRHPDDSGEYKYYGKRRKHWLRELLD